MRVIDSHTGGQPTRVIIDGGPALGSGPLQQRLQRFADQFDTYRMRAVLEPRGSDAVVGALLCDPDDLGCDAGAIFFNNIGYLGMCGHATIGLAVTLAHLGIWTPGEYRLETPVGSVAVALQTPNQVSFDNVESYVFQTDVRVEVPGLGQICGDVAWGGNWFFLVNESPVPVRGENMDALMQATLKIRAALVAAGVTGKDGAEIDHIELFGGGTSDHADSKNFVLCPGGAYDRSACGTGTSAKMACLAKRGDLKPREPWVQESIVGSFFTGEYRPSENGHIIPTLTGTAYITGETRLVFDPQDPFRHGIVL